MNSVSTANTNFVFEYLTCIVPKSIAVPMQRTIQHWVVHHGVEWTVGRLKDLQTQRLHYEIGSDLTLVRSHKDNTPWGSFRPLWGMDLSRALRVLKLYSVERLTQPTQKQMSKFLGAVQSRPWNLAYPLKSGLKLVRNDYTYPHPYHWISSRTRRAPILKENVVVTEVESSTTFSDVISVLDAPLITGHVSKYMSSYANALWVHENTLRDYLRPCDGFFSPNDYRYQFAGKIGLIQEKGAKLRAVANPFRLFQMVLYPLGEAIFDILKTLPWDCTYDQKKGVQFVIESLQNGKTVSSLDLSSATDTFPLKIQMEVIRAIIQRSITSPKPSTISNGRKDQNPTMIPDNRKADLLECLAIFGEVATMDWSLNGHDPISWTKGQPLGLYPSFAMFALTHGVLLRNIEEKLGRVNTFRVLGDDVVINDPEVARIYREDMDYLGCEISPSKSLVSDNVAEFAGEVITSNGVVQASKFCSYKPSDVLGPIRSLHTLKGLKFVPPTMRRKVAALASAPEPVGLGMNPKGLSLDLRMPSELIHWWYSTSRDMPADVHLSRRDLQRRHDLFWQSVSFRFSSFNILEPEIDRKTLPIPDDSQEESPGILVVDHIRAVNRERLFPDDLSLPVPKPGPVPNRGRPGGDALLKAEIGRAHV